MSKRTDAGRSILAAGAIAAFCGTTLLALGRTLKFLFRDVDEDKAEQLKKAEALEEECENDYGDKE